MIHVLDMQFLITLRSVQITEEGREGGRVHGEKRAQMTGKSDKGRRRKGERKERERESCVYTLASLGNPLHPSLYPTLSLSHPWCASSSSFSPRCTHQRTDRGLLGSRSGTCAGQRRIRRWPGVSRKTASESHHHHPLPPPSLEKDGKIYTRAYEYIHTRARTRTHNREKTEKR